VYARRTATIRRKTQQQTKKTTNKRKRTTTESPQAKIQKTEQLPPPPPLPLVDHNSYVEALSELGFEYPSDHRDFAHSVESVFDEQSTANLLQDDASACAQDNQLLHDNNLEDPLSISDNYIVKDLFNDDDFASSSAQPTDEWNDSLFANLW